jgi:ATP-dependent RNA helicase DBP3
MLSCWFTDKGPDALMLSPTRELAQQIAAVMEEAGTSSGLRTLCAYGGVPKPPQVPCLSCDCHSHNH